MPRNELTAAHGLTMANEDYLESVYRISLEGSEGEGVRSVDVAEQLGVSKASVNKAMTALKEVGMVEQDRYGRVRLTDEGRELGSEVWRCHRMLRAFLEADLGVDAEVADKEACLMEHAISRDTMRRWMNYLERQGLSIDAD